MIKTHFHRYCITNKYKIIIRDLFLFVLSRGHLLFVSHTNYDWTETNEYRYPTFYMMYKCNRVRALSLTVSITDPSLEQQVLNEVFYEYPYCERLYHRHENSMLLLFHAGYNDRRQSQSHWNERIHTEIGRY